MTTGDYGNVFLFIEYGLSEMCLHKCIVKIPQNDETCENGKGRKIKILYRSKGN